MGDEQCPQEASYWAAFTLFPSDWPPCLSSELYPSSQSTSKAPSREAGPRCSGREAGSVCPSARGHHRHPPSSHHPSPLITMRINLDAHFVYFHNVVNCPYSTENIFPHFRVLVTQFIAIYSTKADSNSTGERRKKVYQATAVSPRWESEW